MTMCLCDDKLMGICFNMKLVTSGIGQINSSYNHLMM